MRYLFILLACLPLFSMASSLTTLEHQTVIVDGHPLALWSKQVPSAKATILLLHGRTYSSLPDFDLQVQGEKLSFMDQLNDLGYSVYALDGRGYGKTPRDTSGWLTPDRHAKDVAATIQWIRTKTKGEVHVFGWSYGSMVTQLVAQRRPSLMASITLFGYPFDANRHIADPDFDYPSMAPAKANTPQHAASDFITPGTISQKAIDRYVELALELDPRRVDFKNLHEWAELDASKITTPTLLIQAEFDPLANTKIHSEVFTSINTAKKWWLVLQGGDHAALLESPRHEMLRAMDAFISSI